MRKAVVRSPLWPLLRPRRIHVYGVGAMKTGTHSAAGLFSAHYRAAHEAHVPATVQLLEDQRAGELAPDALRRRLKARDRRWRLECEAGHHLAPVSGALAELFPRARFLLTVREPRAWLRSMTDHFLRKPRGHFLQHPGELDAWAALRDLNFGAPPWEHAPREAPLRGRGIPPLRTLLAYWARHNRTVLTAIPAHQLLIVRTSDLSEHLGRVADFLEVAPSTLSQERSHQYQAPKNHDILEALDTGHVEHQIRECCGEVLGELADRGIAW